MQDAYQNLEIATTVDQKHTARERIRRLEMYLNAYERRLRKAEQDQQRLKPKIDDKETADRGYFVEVYRGPVPPRKPADIYRFQSFGPAPPRKRPFLPLPTSRNNPRPSEEELARDPAKALRQTPGPSPAQLKTNEKKKTKSVKRPSGRDMQIYSVIEKGLKGRAYARRVHDEGVRTPKRWRERGCPYFYPEAYAIPKPWRDEIYREKYDVKKRVEAFKNLPRFS